MNIIQQCFTQDRQRMIERLQDVGYSDEQASDFLDGVADSIADSLELRDAGRIMEDLEKYGPAEMIRFINIELLARMLGMEPTRVALGITTITPLLAKSLSRQQASIVDTVASLLWSKVGRFNNDSQQ